MPICACGCNRVFKSKSSQQKFFDKSCQYRTKLKIQKARRTPVAPLKPPEVPTVLTLGEIEQRDIKLAIDARYLGENDPGRRVTGEEFDRLAALYMKREFMKLPMDIR